MTLFRLLALSLASCSFDPAPVPSAPAVSVPTIEPSESFDHEHALWTGILQRHVQGTDFEYGALAEKPDELRAYLDLLHGVIPTELAGWTDKQRFAFWINVYNAHTVQLVIENYPLKSIRKLDKAFGLKSVFDQAWIPMAAHHPEKPGELLSLNDIEHGILRAGFPDARLHAAINCASESCPPLLNEAFVAHRLDQQLESQMRAFVADPARNRFDREKGVAYLSEIFKWFAEDFERDAESVRDYVTRFASAEDATFLREARLRYLDYSWDLNDVRRDD